MSHFIHPRSKPSHIALPPVPPPLQAGSVALLVPSMEESALGVLLGDGVMHASADLLMEVLEAL